MAYIGVLRHLQILHNYAGSHHAKREMLHTETLERLRAEVLEELLTRTLLRKHPVVQLERTPPVAEPVLEFTLHLTVVQHLLRLERHQQLLHVIGRALPYQKFSRRDIEKRHAACRLRHVYGSQKVVLLIVQHRVVHRHAGRNKLRNATLYEGLSKLRIFQLVADGNALSGTDELRQISVESMIRETSHLASRAIGVLSVGATCKRNAKNLSRLHGVISVSLVEVAAAEEQQSVRIGLLERIKLSHHRRKSIILLFLNHILGLFCFLFNYVSITMQTDINIKMYRLQLTKEIKKNGIRKFMVMNLKMI